MSSEEEQTQGPAVFDSLPYYDNDLERDPGLKDKAERLIARELKPHKELHPKVPPPLDLFSKNPLLQAELARVESHQPLPPLDTTRYQLPGPSSSQAGEKDWDLAVKNAHAQLEHQRLRQTNLALLQNYGSNAWRIHNFQLESTAKLLDKTVEGLKQLTVEVNRDRKNFQTTTGSQLTSLETKWTELISNVLQIEMANVALEAEIDRLNKKEVELAGL
ncbi:breast carcinoma amplified sequence 2 [Irpex rosettiformis]|uniref:Breast carcinoma amplified sequence 2 n=1 Tax=Irpex rosettiformis TaxID=378272 RepID=A0ACB8ULA7_9APHY|nr:breast carcinoma amplified sequence 2 [Irpex rosettiformis]